MPGIYTIKELDMRDLQEALTLVWDVFLAFEAPDYCEEGVQEFKAYIEYEAIRTKLLQSQLRMWACYDDKKVIGVLAARPPCHISLLFVDRRHHRKGIARGMLGEMIRCCEGKGGCSEITVNSSPYAIKAYHKLGFMDTDSEQTVNGIRFIPMKRTI